MSETRKLAAILVADVVGYSWLRRRADEDRTLARLRGLRSDLIDPAIAAHHGRIVKRTGDGSIVEFRSVVDAVRCAIEMQNGLIERNAGVPDNRRIEFRVGHRACRRRCRGERRRSDGRRGVNVAARLEGDRRPRCGSCLLRGRISASPRQDQRDVASDLGDHSLKQHRAAGSGILDPKTSAAGSRLCGPFVGSGKSPKGRLGLSIVVLPFSNIGSNVDQEYFVDGVTESLTTDLSRMPGMLVIGRNTAFAYKGKSGDLKQIGRGAE